MRLPRVATRAIARVKPAIPASAWPLLNALASIPGDAPLVLDPSPRPTVVLLAHPDDELGCAGTLAKLARRVAVRPVYATRGDATRGSAATPAETGRLRSEEAAKACEVLGMRPPMFLSYGDGQLPAHIDELARDVEAAVVEHGAKQVFVPWFLDGHADHRAMSAAVARANLPSDVEVWAFEWWTAMAPNRIVDVSAQWPQKQDAASCHVTAAQAFDISAGIWLSRWRSLHGLHGQGYAEAFIALPHQGYRDLSNRLVGAS